VQSTFFGSIKCCLVILLLIPFGLVQAQVYKCIQADGVVLYTDRGCSAQQSLEDSGEVSAVSRVGDAFDSRWPVWRSDFKSLLQYTQPVVLLLVLYMLMSPICFLAYYRDKQQAIRGLQRIPEARLHLYEFLGGWPGGLLAQRLIRHKNRKLSYQRQFWLIVAIHTALFAFIVLIL
jgi:uncharacterized membrane protein YsdA (DUF1294 family)